MIRVLLPLIAAFGVPASAAAPARMAWEFSQDGNTEGWRPHSQHLTQVEVRDGALHGRAVDWDPFLISPVFDLPASHRQWIELRVRAEGGGRAEIFWSGTLKTKYGGFSPGKSTPFEVIGDGAWHVYHVYPAWAAGGKIIHLRLDFPAASADRGYGVAVEYLRIRQLPDVPPAARPRWSFDRGTEHWGLAPAPGASLSPRDGALVVKTGTEPARLVAPPVDFPAASAFLVTVRMAVSHGEAATLGFATDGHAGRVTRGFPVRADGHMHSYVLDFSNERRWRGRLRFLSLVPTDAPQAQVTLDHVAVAAMPNGPPELEVRRFGLAEGLPRAGQRLSFAAVVRNTGGAAARKLVATVTPPDGLKVADPVQHLDNLWYGETHTFRWPVECPKPLEGQATLRVVSDDGAALDVIAAFHVEPSLGLPKADSVPRPRPARTDVQVGAYYFPGWPSWSRWAPIADFPERKPLLGWYDESRPEVADWQIKWAVEHGISFFAVDWYWCQGARQLEHWLHEAYFKSRYHRLLKFCLLWANHNPPDTSSEADLLRVTNYGLEHYFRRPEYLTLDGKPVVIIFSTYRLTQDLGAEGVAAAFRKMNERCRTAGLPGLYLVACTRDDRRTIQRLKAQGYDAISGYNYPDLNAGGKLHAPYAALLGGYKTLWETAAGHGLLPVIPALSGGWDSRPWHGQGARARTGRTPALFERHCRDAKAFLDEYADGPRARKMCIIEAWNEWGEGSYVAPHAEYGFGYLEAVRRVFAPDAPRPVPVTPRDVGLGPYDLSRTDRPQQAAWDFSRPEDREQWRLAAQIAAEASQDALAGAATGRDPVIHGPAVRIPAAEHRWLHVQMQSSAADTAQLFWRTTTAPVSENNSIRITLSGDGRVHGYWVDLHESPYWTGLVTGLRLDPCGRPGTAFSVRHIAFTAARER